MFHTGKGRSTLRVARKMSHCSFSEMGFSQAKTIFFFSVFKIFLLKFLCFKLKKKKIIIIKNPTKINRASFQKTQLEQNNFPWFCWNPKHFKENADKIKTFVLTILSILFHYHLMDIID